MKLKLITFSLITTLGFYGSSIAGKCPRGYTATSSLDIIFQNVNTNQSPDFFMFNTGSGIVAPGNKVIIPRGSQWVAQGRVYPGGTVTDLLNINPGDARPLGKWICQGGISRTSKILEPSRTHIGKDLGVGSFSLIFRSNPYNPNQLFGSYTARTIDPTVAGTGESGRLEFKAISSGTGANKNAHNITIKSKTYIDSQFNILLRYEVLHNKYICVPAYK